MNTVTEHWLGEVWSATVEHARIRVIYEYLNHSSFVLWKMLTEPLFSYNALYTLLNDT
jgi:hypothetical protein